jgi:hypothetical protein
MNAIYYDPCIQYIFVQFKLKGQKVPRNFQRKSQVGPIP